MKRTLLRLGAMAVRMESPTRCYPERFAALFEMPAGAPPAADHRTLEVRFLERRGRWAKVPPDGLVVRRRGQTFEVHTEAVSARLRERPGGWRAAVTVRQPDPEGRELAVHFAVVFGKLLGLMGYLRLHAAAAELAGEAVVFIGDKGAGKSTLSLTLGRAGWTLLADDDVLVRRVDGRLVGSGCNETIRVTAATERHFFDTPLPIRPIFSGTELKKEMLATDIFRAAPYREVPVRGLFFTRVADRFGLVSMSGQQATLALLAFTRKSQRFSDAEDCDRYLRLLASLLDGVPAYRLELSPDLGDLNQLVDRLRPVNPTRT